jgi:hypothetical protein
MVVFVKIAGIKAYNKEEIEKSFDLLKYPQNINLNNNPLKNKDNNQQ